MQKQALTNNKNLIITLAVLFAFALSVSLVYMILNWFSSEFDIDKEQKDFFSRLQLLPENYVLLLGSSQVGELNATYIQQYLQSDRINYQVYNLAIQADVPTERQRYVDEIISIHPKIVVYGIGLRDFEKVSVTTSSFGGGFSATKSIDILPDPHQFFTNLISKMTFLKTISNKINNPQLLTLKAIDGAFGQKQFPVSDHVLLEIYSIRPDLQKAFPEAARGNLDNLKKWAMEYGWNETQRLYILTPPGKTPSYLQHNLNENSNSSLLIHTPFYLYQNDESTIMTQNELENFVKQYPFESYDEGFDPNDLSALENIVEKLDNNNIKVVIVLVPYSHQYLDSISLKDKEFFDNLVQHVKKDTGVKVYSLEEKYANMPIWKDATHVALNRDTIIYSQDVAEIIANETQ